MYNRFDINPAFLKENPWWRRYTDLFFIWMVVFVVHLMGLVILLIN